MSDNHAISLAKLILIGMAVQLVVIAYIFGQAYLARSQLVTANRNACERGKLDRIDNARGWRTAQTARMTTVAEKLSISVDVVKLMLPLRPNPVDLPDLVAARQYNVTALHLEKRSRINCSEKFPKAGLLP